MSDSAVLARLQELRASPAGRWLERWGVSVASLVGGLLALFVFRRELPHVGWIVGYTLLLWLLVALLTEIRRRPLEHSPRRAARLVVTGVDYTVQTLYHGLLLFLLPAYWASTTLDSPNAVFFVVLAVLALVTTFDPWYRALVHPRPWVGSLFFVVCVFGALNMALPLVGVPPHPALILSTWAAAMALAPALWRASGWPWRRAVAALGVLALALTLVVHVGRAWIPPAPLSLASATLAWSAEADAPALAAGEAITAAELLERGLVARTAVFAPAGLRLGIRHVWRHEGRAVDVVELSPVRTVRRWRHTRRSRSPCRCRRGHASRPRR